MQPNILWITLDSVRADHTSVHGYERPTTPRLEELAGEDRGRAFDQCIAHSSRTPVSVPSMMTGTYPSSHRIGIGTDVGSIPPSLPTAPDLAGDAGYYTVGVSENAYAGAATRLDERFDVFRNTQLGVSDALFDPDYLRTLLKYAPNVWKHGPGPRLDPSAHGEQLSFFTTDVAKRELRRANDRDQPFFAYVHYNDPHRPYLPPHSHRDVFTAEVEWSVDEALSFAREMHENAFRCIAEGLPFSDVEWDMLQRMYDSVLRYVDECVGNLVDYVRDRFGDTIVVVTADHGELFGEHGLLGHHIVLDDALVHVPMVVYGFDELPEADAQLVQHVDVMQTILDRVGADVSQFQGVDLRSESRDVAVSQDLRGTVADPESRNYERILQYDADFDVSPFHRSLLTAARTERFKLLHTEEWTRLHELPDETTDVSTDEPAVHEDLLTFTEDWLATVGQPLDVSPDETEYSRDVEEQLRDMGYLE